jgi:hypothetical protein
MNLRLAGEPLSEAEDGREEIAGLGHAVERLLRRGEQRAGTARIHRGSEVRERDRQRDGRPGALGAERVGSHRGLVAVVLAPIHEDTAGAMSLVGARDTRSLIRPAITSATSRENAFVCSKPAGMLSGT